MKRVYIDFHSHILPGIDDGSESVAMTQKMFELEKKSGVGTIVATPHFYLSSQKLDDFLENREEAYEKVTDVADDMGIELFLGAEVLYTPSLADLDLKKLCVGDTRYMMVELPYQKLSRNFIRSFRSFVGDISSEITPILAHAERYLNFTSAESLYEIMDCEMIVQLNSGSFKPFSSKLKFMLDLIKHDMAHLLGTDCHNTTSRAPNMDMARKMIERKFSAHHFSRLMDNADAVLSGERLGE